MRTSCINHSRSGYMVTLANSIGSIRQNSLNLKLLSVLTLLSIVLFAVMSAVMA